MTDNDLTSAPTPYEEEVSYGVNEPGAPLSPGTVVVPPSNTAFDSEVQEGISKLEEEMAGEPQLVDREFTLASHMDPQRQRDPHGVYLDDVQRQQAEIDRARKEDREPNLDNPPPYAGDKIIPTEVAKQQYPDAVTYPVSFTQEVAVGQPVNPEEFTSEDKQYLEGTQEAAYVDEYTDDDSDDE